MAAKRELFKSSDVCELTQLQPYMLRSWEAEFPGLGKPAGSGGGRLYRRADVDMVLRIKELVFGEGLTLAGARRRLEEEQQQGTTPSVAAAAVDDVLDDFARRKLREVRSGLEAILQIVSRRSDGSLAELELVAPSARAKASPAKRRRAS